MSRRRQSTGERKAKATPHGGKLNRQKRRAAAETDSQARNRKAGSPGGTDGQAGPTTHQLQRLADHFRPAGR